MSCFKCVYCCFFASIFFEFVWFGCFLVLLFGEKLLFLIPLFFSLFLRHWLAGGWRNFDIWNFHHLDLTAWDKLRANKKRRHGFLRSEFVRRNAMRKQMWCHRIPCIEHWAAFIYKKTTWNCKVKSTSPIDRYWIWPFWVSGNLMIQGGWRLNHRCFCFHRGGKMLSMFRFP